MQTSVFLARLIGPVCLAVAIGLFANRPVYMELAREVLKSRALIYLSGVLSMTAGLAVVLSHNIWAADWRVLVTILGWLAAVGGAVRIVLPQGTEAIGRRVLDHPQGLTIAGAVWLALGVILSFFGYFR
jgi:hypothetical protein